MEELKQRITESVYHRLLEFEIDSLKAIIFLSPVELQEKVRISSSEAKTVLDEAAYVLGKRKIVSVLDLPPWTRIKTGCSSIDTITNGGIPTNGITEIYGCGGVGKTQICLQLALMVQFPLSAGGLEKGAVYICTEDIFPSKRLNVLCKLLPKRFGQSTAKRYEENIFVEHITDYEQMRRLLCVRLPKLLEKVAMGLIVVDSIAGVFRSETKDINYITRSEQIYSVSSTLREISTKYNLTVICINQVTDDLTTGQSKPCLGHSWANLVTSRFEICRLTSEGTTRMFQVVNCPDLPQRSCSFIITPGGLSIGYTKIASKGVTRDVATLLLS